MTVGIAAIANGQNNPHVVFCADRMVTLGQGTSIEYEDTSSKLEKVVDTDSIIAMAVGSGSLSLIDSTIRWQENLMVDSPPSDLTELADQFRQSFQAIERDTINQRSLSTFDVEIEDFLVEDLNVPTQFQEAIINDISNIRSQLREGMNMIIGGVDQDDAQLYIIGGPDYTDMTNTGYAIVGSGTDSAQLTFLRNRYDSDEADVKDGIFAVAEAKIQAEERQGVGQQMDMAVLGPEGIETVDDIDRLRQLLEEVQDAQQSERQRVMDKWDGDDS